MWTRWLTVMALAEEDVRPDEHPRLCQRHFERKDFLTRELSGMAVPVRNLHRVKDKKAPVMEEQQPAEDGKSWLEAAEQETFDGKGIGSDDTVGENVSEYGAVEDELDSLVESEQNASPLVAIFKIQLFPQRLWRRLPICFTTSLASSASRHAMRYRFISPSFTRARFTSDSWGMKVKRRGFFSSSRMTGLASSRLICCRDARHTLRGTKSQLLVMRAGMMLVSFQ
uniref:THAP-type domain-containing protein n=1 Tax=Anopheles merus TaxID=30066 RepID=A0A182V0E6_ANOME